MNNKNLLSIHNLTHCYRNGNNTLFSNCKFKKNIFHGHRKMLKKLSFFRKYSQKLSVVLLPSGQSQESLYKNIHLKVF